MRYEAVVFDVDDVLKPYTPQDILRPFDPAAIDGIKLLKSRGMEICYASGKSAPYVKGCIELSGLGIDDYIIGENGAVIWTPDGPEYATEHMKDIETLREMVYAHLDGQKRHITEEPKDASLTFLLSPELSPKEFARYLQGVIRSAELNLDTVYGSGYVDIVQMGVNKSQKLKKFSEKTGIPYERMVGVGDGRNDIPFLNRVGLPAAPSNAIEDVKELIKRRGGYVASCPVGEGVLEICRFLIENEF